MAKSVVVLACMLASFASALRSSTNSGISFEDAAKVIQQNVAAYSSTSSDICDKNTCCTLSEKESCDIGTFAKDKTTLVLPGGETRCIYSYSTPFAFQVIPGDSDKIVFYLQGGGACWDEISSTLGFCTSDASPSSLSGIFDRTNEKNKFKSHTIVQVLYCSGDVHVGNTVRPYNDRQGEPIVQKGLANAQATLDWVAGQQATGALAETFSELVIMGCSAGSIGAQVWGKQVLNTLKWSKASVTPDSYAGVFPEGSMGPEIYNFGFCSSGFLSPELYAKCMAQEVTLQEMDVEFMLSTPTVPYTFVQSKVDVVQQSFYIAIGITGNYSDAMINPTEFYNGVNEIFGGYNAVAPNFVTYLVDGGQHCFTPSNVLYSADAMGPKDNGETNSGDMLYEWVDKLALENTQTIDTVCEGEVQSDSAIKMVEKSGNTYCSASVVPKEFIEKY